MLSNQEIDMGLIAALLYFLGVCQEFMTLRNSTISLVEFYEQTTEPEKVFDDDDRKTVATEHEYPWINITAEFFCSVCWPITTLYVIVASSVESITGRVEK